MKTVFNDYAEIISRFLNREPAKTPLAAIYGAPGEDTRGGSFSYNSGTHKARRLESDGTRLISYGHYVLAEFTSTGLTVYPCTDESNTTKKQAGELMYALRTWGNEYAVGVPALVHNDEITFIPQNSVEFIGSKLRIGSFAISEREARRVLRITNFKGKTFTDVKGEGYEVAYADEMYVIVGCSMFNLPDVKNKVKNYFNS